MLRRFTNASIHSFKKASRTNVILKTVQSKTMQMRPAILSSW